MHGFPSLAELVKQVNLGRIQPEDLVEDSLKSIENQEPRISAWVQIDAQNARAAAATLSRKIKQEGTGGDLAGVVLGVKDIVDLAGMRTVSGSPLRNNDDYLAAEDAPLVSRFKRAGAIVIGKTETTQFACFDPAPTRNPWNTSHTPGGSSSGSAAAVAAGMCHAAIGSQTGGSIIRPASFCGVAGLKPTLHALSTKGFTPISPRLDHPGPIARTAGDLQTIWNAIADEPDATGVEQTAAIFRPHGYFWENAATEVVKITADAVKAAELETASPRPLPPSFAQVHEMHWRIMQVDAAAYHRVAFEKNPDGFAPKIAGLIEGGLRMEAEKYAEAVCFQRTFTREMQTWLGNSIAVMPSTADTAPGDLTTTGDAAFQSPWSFTGQPVVTIPCGVTGDGMPCGLQLVASHGNEAMLLRTATAAEKLIDFPYLTR